MADAKICDCCGMVATDLHEARMHVFYIQDEPIKEDDGKCRWWRVKKETPNIEIDLCGRCWDKLRGLAGGGLDGE